MKNRRLAYLWFGLMVSIIFALLTVMETSAAANNGISQQVTPTPKCTPTPIRPCPTPIPPIPWPKVTNGGGGGCNCYILTPDQVRQMLENLVFDFSIPQFERNAPLTLNYSMPDTPNPIVDMPDTPGPIVEQIYHYRMDSNEIELFSERTLSANEEDFNTWGTIPHNAVSGDYLLVICGLEDCSPESVLQNLDSPLIAAQQWSLPAVDITDVNNLNDQVIRTQIFVDPGIDPRDVEIQINKDGSALPTTNNRLQSTTPVSTIYNNGINLYAPGIYWPAQIGWQGLFPNQLEPGNYTVEVSVNGITEDKIEFAIGSP